MKRKTLTPLERMADLAKRISGVPKAEYDERERKWKAERKRKSRR